MTLISFHQPAFSRRNPDMLCWRISAIYRCVLRFGKDRNWALEKIREISPDGTRDHMVDLWFSNIEDVRSFLASKKGLSKPGMNVAA